jgi:hypothetical protein
MLERIPGVLKGLQSMHVVGTGSLLGSIANPLPP